MPDYKELYLKMMRASETAVRILIRAQQECGELYLEEEEADSSEQPAISAEKRSLM